MPYFDNLKGTSEAAFQVGLNGVRIYADQATNPTSPTPKDGDIYYNTALDMWMQYNASRTKWLSLEARTLPGGRNGNTATGSYYRSTDGAAFSSVDGYVAAYNGTVVGIGYTRQDTDDARFDVTVNGSTVAFLVSSALKGYSNTLNGDFSAGDILGARNATIADYATGNTTSVVSIWVSVRWRL